MKDPLFVRQRRFKAIGLDVLSSILRAPMQFDERFIYWLSIFSHQSPTYEKMLRLQYQTRVTSAPSGCGANQQDESAFHSFHSSIIFTKSLNK
jgi:hypothetical protein